MMDQCDLLGGISVGGIKAYTNPIIVYTCFDWYRAKYNSWIPTKSYVESCKNKIIEIAERFILNNKLNIKLIIGEIKWIFY